MLELKFVAVRALRIVAFALAPQRLTQQNRETKIYQKSVFRRA